MTVRGKEKELGFPRFWWVKAWRQPSSGPQKRGKTHIGDMKGGIRVVLVRCLCSQAVVAIAIAISMDDDDDHHDY